jgi:hypothetical protein
VIAAARGALAAVVAAVALLLAWPAAGAGAGCAIASDPRDAWHAVSVPAGTVDVTQDDADPCRMYAASSTGVWRSRDGGGRWERAAGASGADHVDAETLGPRTAVASGRGGVWLTRDAGQTWAQPGGLPPSGPVLSAARLGDTLYLATGAAAPAASVYASRDGGASFVPLPSSVVLAATRVAISGPGAAGAPVVWAAGPAGLAVSLDGGVSFVPRRTEPISDLAAGTSLDGGRWVVAASAVGLLTSGDDGTSFLAAGGGDDPVVRLETRRPDIFLTIGGPSPRRYTGRGRFVTPYPAGFPGSCPAPQLERAADEPGTFLATCATTWWRFRASGGDFGVPVPPPPTSTPPVTIPGASVLPVLARRPLPVAGNSSDGTVAFDGTLLYWVASGEVSIHRMTAATGVRKPDILADELPAAPSGLSYDPVRNVLYATVDHDVWTVDLRTGHARLLFRMPSAGFAPGLQPVVYSYDYRIDRFHVAQELGSRLAEIDRGGTLRHSCSWNSPGVPTPSGEGLLDTVGVVGDGDGGTYVELENDANLIHLDRGCHLLGAYAHAEFGEAANENENLACDTVTFFPTPAIWIRDTSGSGEMVAYGMPDGYCPAPTTLTVAAPASALSGVRQPACVTMLMAGSKQPVRGQPVTLLLDARLARVGITDATGRVCAGLRPAVGQHALRASFAGNRSFLPATATGAVLVVPVFAPRPPLLVAVQPAPAPAFVAPPGGGTEPPPGQSAAQPQVNPQTQSQPEVQTGMAGAAATEQQEEVRLARQEARDDTLQMSVLSQQPRRDEAVFVMAAGLVLAGSAAVAARHRRVTSQSR